jgi:hypothetical protein
MRIEIDPAGLDDTNKKVNSMAKAGKTLALMVVLAMVAIGAGLVIALWMGNHEAVAPVVLPDQVQIPQPPEIVPPAATFTNIHANGFAQQQRGRGWTNPVDPADSLPWDQRLDGILLRGGEASDKADAIRKLMTVAPAEAEVELSQHLINMVQDDRYDPAAELLTNATTPAAVATVLMNDLLNRRNNLKLPMLLAIARNDQHPLKDQAKDMLELFLQADYSTNWDQWGGAVDAWLQQNQ